MKIFLDTADVDLIGKYYETGLIDGVTTNATLCDQSWGGAVVDGCISGASGTAIIDVPAGTQSLSWTLASDSWPGERYFEIYAPNGDLLYVGGGATDTGGPIDVEETVTGYYFAEIDTIWIVKNIDEWLNKKSKSLPKKSIYMNNLPSETWHGFKYIDFGPDGNLYIPVGVPCNICIEPQTNDNRFAAIHKYKDGELITVADGVRNSVGFDWHPVTKKMYFSDNGRDWLGDDSPSCELNVVNEEGSFYGYPYKHSKDVIDPEFGHLIPTIDKKFIDPIAELGPHGAPLGFAF